MLAELHDAMLPKGLPVPQRVEIAARYLLAEDYAGAGGDWFDAISLPDGRVVVVVGDVVGHGIEASVVMAGLKTLFEERVRVDGDIVAALDLLDARARRTREARATTVCVGVLDTRTGALTYCTAGHPPPVIVTADGVASYLPATGAGPLGSGHGFPTAEHVLAEGDLVLFYSDGLVERPDRTPSQGTVDLLRVVEATVHEAGVAPSGSEQVVEQMCRRSLELLTGASGYADDITLLAFQTVPETPVLELDVPALPEAVRTIRAELGDWLELSRIGAVDQVVAQHAVGEIVSNVVAHAYPSTEGRNPLRVSAVLSADGVVEITVADDGRWSEPVDRGGGRGLAIARSFLDELEIGHDEAGTTVRGRFRATRPASLLQGAATAAAEQRTTTIGLAVDDRVVHVSGVVDLRSAEDLRNACARASRGGAREITVNLSEVDLLSSAAVQALYDARAAGVVDLVAPLGTPAQHVLDLVHLPYRPLG